MRFFFSFSNVNNASAQVVRERGYGGPRTGLKGEFAVTLRFIWRATSREAQTEGFEMFLHICSRVNKCLTLADGFPLSVPHRDIIA